MSESNNSDEQLAARKELAAELRRGMHLLLERDPSASKLEELSQGLAGQFDELERAPERTRFAAPWEQPGMSTVPSDGQPFPDSGDRPISGTANPFSIPMEIRRDGDAVTATVTLGPGFEGAPGRSHGGFVSAIFDDLFGSIPMMLKKIAFTASLTVNYLAPSPIRAPVTYRGWIDRVEGKKIFVAGEAHDGDTLVTTATGLFIDATEAMKALYGA